VWSFRKAVAKGLYESIFLYQNHEDALRFLDIVMRKSRLMDKRADNFP
jgi:hypothetical protein